MKKKIINILFIITYLIMVALSIVTGIIFNK